MSEHDFARKLTKGLRDRGIYVWKINANFAVGVPDMWIAGSTGDMWLELKWGKLPIRARTAINFGLSSKQLHWLKERHLQGVRVAVIWACPDGVLILDVPKDWAGMDTERAKTLLMPYRNALDVLCCNVSTGEASNERPRTLAAFSGTARDCNPAEIHLVKKARRAGANPDSPRRQNGHDPGRIDAVPKPACRREHRLCAGLLPGAGR